MGVQMGNNGGDRVAMVHGIRPLQNRVTCYKRDDVLWVGHGYATKKFI